MKRIYFLLFVLLPLAAKAQPATSYSFSAFSNTYTSIAATGTAIVGGMSNCDDCATTSIPIGFSFNFCGTNYTQTAACSNGFLSLANSAAAPGTNNQGSIGSAGWLMPYWGDLYSAPQGCTTTSSAYYQTTGIAPNRVFTFEWKDFNEFAWAGACVCCVTNMQVKLYETSNTIDFCYGNSTTSMGPTQGATIGIANSTADWQTLNNVSATPTPSSTTFYTTAFITAPALNQVYRWGPCTAGSIPITGVTTVCPGSTTTLSAGVPGGTWSSGTTANATVTTGPVGGGVVSGVNIAGGTSIITYAMPGGCYSTTTVTVNSLPSTITGITTLCVGNTALLSDSPAGGSWSSSNTTVATIVSGTGILTGVSAGTANISYSTSCGRAITSLTVTTLPSAGTITGPTRVCAGAIILLTDPVAGGIWSCSNTSFATVSGGTVTGVSTGVAIISYTVANSCGTSRDTMAIRIDNVPDPGTITGRPGLCEHTTIILSDNVTGGIWSSGSTSVATINPVTGIVTGVSMGTTTITYTVSGGCGTFMATRLFYVLSTAMCPTNINQLASEQSTELKVFPNPNAGVFTVNLLSAADEEAHIVVTNMVGEKVREINTTTNKTVEIKLDPSPGLYLVFVSTAHSRDIAKIVVE